MKEIKLTRKELYDLVWSEPMTSLSKKYQISDVGLRKICIKMSVPLPRKGHWNKVLEGKSIYIAMLSENYSGNDSVTLKLREQGQLPTISIQARQNILKKEIESNIELSTTVPSILIGPDILISNLKSRLKEYHKGYNDIIYPGWENIDVRVTRKHFERALLFMDTLIKLLKKRGFSIKINGKNTYAVLEKEELQISLREKFERIPSENSWSSDSRPTGILVFSLRVSYRASEWKDGKLLLEEQLMNILTKIEVKSKEEKEERIEREKRWAQQEEEERLKNELKQRQERELTNFKELLNKANRWHQTNILRKYIESIESKPITEEIESWLEWAKGKADWFDPNIEKEDALLKDIERRKL
jgi:hypothetical protein